MPKVHKTHVPLRPILDMRGSPYHSVAKWLAEKLEPVRKALCPHSLRDTFDFVSMVSNINVNKNLMCSLDVNSLFTNVPLIETVEFICEYIDNTVPEFPLPTSLLKELILRCTLNVQFKFNGELYRQIDGVSMGSPLGPILADIFMGKLEATKLNNKIKETKFYCRYVDDIFAVLSNENELISTQDAFNQAHSSISFTSEK